MQKAVIGPATLYCGDSLEILRILDEQFDAVVTDPPYSSGGMTRGDRVAKPSDKYINSTHHHEFYGDNRDARSWAFWMTQWLSQVNRLVVPGGYAMVFTDWRQLPTLTDVFQAGGFIWRGLVPWDKTLSSRAPHTGYFRHQCEYIVWGSMPGESAGNAYRKVFQAAMNRDKVTGANDDLKRAGPKFYCERL
ncbi:TPA: DNA methyltransferase [Enterobacter roggenkampii]